MPKIGTPDKKWLNLMSKTPYMFHANYKAEPMICCSKQNF